VQDEITMELNARKIFNPLGDDSIGARQLIGGSPTGIANMNSVKYKWATNLYKIMIGNFWVPEKVSLVDDRVTIKELTADEMAATKNSLSFLIALDSMQTANLPKLADYITAPEVQNLFTLQAFQEMIHSLSYQYILQELFSSVDREEIYNYWRTNPKLLERNEYIAAQYEKFNEHKTRRNFKIALAADFALEGIYFYNGFNFFYQLASRNKIANVAKLIKYIENDEVTHVSFMSHLIREEFDMTNEDDQEILRSTIMTAAEHEIDWGKENYGDRILGISEKSTEGYNKFLANKLGKVIGLGVLYKGFTVNPYEYLSQDKKENFFETKVVEYSQSTAVDGWEDF
jgi:ribonucleoside-diphosphate reductase beta chain